MTPNQGKEGAIHPIQAVSRRTGLSADVIRAWERRYHVVEPARSPTRRRLYTDADVERLILLRRATLAGRRIGDVAGIPSEQLASLIEADEAAAAAAPGAPTDAADPTAIRQAALAALEQLEVSVLETTLERASRDLSLRSLVAEVLMPMMDEVGDRWSRGDLDVHHEHLASAVVRSLLDALRASHSATFAGPELIVATPSGQRHELGALTCAVLAAGHHWRVTYLGPDLPAEQIARVASHRRARAVALSLIHPEDDPGTHRQLAELRARLPRGIAIVTGGRAARSYEDTLREHGIERLEDVRQLGEVLGRLKAARSD